MPKSATLALEQLSEETKPRRRNRAAAAALESLATETASPEIEPYRGQLADLGAVDVPAPVSTPTPGGIGELVAQASALPFPHAKNITLPKPVKHTGPGISAITPAERKRRDSTKGRAEVAWRRFTESPTGKMLRDFTTQTGTAMVASDPRMLATLDQKTRQEIYAKATDPEAAANSMKVWGGLGLGGAALAADAATGGALTPLYAALGLADLGAVDQRTGWRREFEKDPVGTVLRFGTDAAMVGAPAVKLMGKGRAPKTKPTPQPWKPSLPASAYEASDPFAMLFSGKKAIPISPRSVTEGVKIIVKDVRTGMRTNATVEELARLRGATPSASPTARNLSVTITDVNGRTYNLPWTDATHAAILSYAGMHLPTPGVKEGTGAGTTSGAGIVAPMVVRGKRAPVEPTNTPASEPAPQGGISQQPFAGAQGNAPRGISAEQYIAAVDAAIARGETVAPDVMADYTDLMARGQAQSPAADVLEQMAAELGVPQVEAPVSNAAPSREEILRDALDNPDRYYFHGTPSTDAAISIEQYGLDAGGLAGSSVDASDYAQTPDGYIAVFRREDVPNPAGDVSLVPDWTPVKPIAVFKQGEFGHEIPYGNRSQELGDGPQMPEPVPSDADKERARLDYERERKALDQQGYTPEEVQDLTEVRPTSEPSQVEAPVAGKQGAGERYRWSNLQEIVDISGGSPGHAPYTLHVTDKPDFYFSPTSGRLRGSGRSWVAKTYLRVVLDPDALSASGWKPLKSTYTVEGAHGPKGTDVAVNYKAYRNAIKAVEVHGLPEGQTIDDVRSIVKYRLGRDVDVVDKTSLSPGLSKPGLTGDGVFTPVQPPAPEPGPVDTPLSTPATTGKRTPAARKPEQAPTPEPEAPKTTLVSKEEADAAIARIKAKLGRLNVGADPELMADGIKVAIYYIESGVRTWADYTREMVSLFGDAVKPHLRSWYEGARWADGMDATGMTPSEQIQGVEPNAPADVQSIEETSYENTPERGDREDAETLAGVPAEDGEGTGSRGQAGRRGTDGRSEHGTRDGSTSGRGDESRPGVGSGPRDVHVPAGGETRLTPAGNYTITAADLLGAGGQKTKYRDNVAAIRTLKEIQAAGRPATADEQAILVKYVGWGGIPQAFDARNREWAAEYSELKSLLTDEEYATARQSTQYAHYTAPGVVSAMWNALDRMGFTGGRVLEPAMGTGNFFGLLPASLRGNKTSLFGVELDPITGGIASLLYPKADVHVTGFQDVLVPDGHFDVAIGNPPFSSVSVHDGRDKEISGFSLHNYFFAKSIKALRPGGVLAMVVSNSLMDKKADKQRQYFASKARLLGAIRLPNNAFKQNAGTEVTADILFLQRLMPGEIDTGETWASVSTVPDPDGGEPIPLNEYYIRHPEMMLGTMTRQGSMYRADQAALTAPKGQDTDAELARAIANLPEGVYREAGRDAAELTLADVLVPEGVKVQGYFVAPDGRIAQRTEDVLDKRQADYVDVGTETVRARMAALIGLRDALAALMRAELSPKTTDAALKTLRANLNKVYDALVKKYGYVHAKGNRDVFRWDPDYPLLLSLEPNYNAGVSKDVAKKHGTTPIAPSAGKADIFTKRVSAPFQAAVKADSPKDALTISLAETGRVNFPRMSELTGLSESDLQAALADDLFLDPDAGWVTGDEYLSGNVKKKLAQAKRMAESDPAFARNVTALEAVQPEDIEASDIYIMLGAPWVAPQDIAAFYNHLTGGTVHASYTASINMWSVRVNDYGGHVENTVTWGTSRVGLSDMFERILNGKEITVWDKDSDGKRYVAKEATAEANNKAQAVRREFREWLFEDDDRRERLHRVYNDTYNTDRARHYDGSHMIFPGMSLAVQLRPHQKDVVWRIVQTGKALLDHVVGAGKTFAVIASAMEMRRMGLVRKPMIVVPNHLVGQWGEDILRLYPGARALVATKADFAKDRRKLLFSRIATGDWDIVVVAHSSFGMIGMPKEEQQAFLREQIQDMAAAIGALSEDKQSNSRAIKQMEKRKENLQNKLAEAMDTGDKDDTVDFNQLGVDFLFVDEAHEFKNLAYVTSKTRVKGLGNPAGSNKAMDLFVKARWLQRMNNGTGVGFATGTPVSNSIAEMFTMMRYLAYDELKSRAIAHFDAWANLFTQTKTEIAADVTGRYKPTTVISEFENLPEMLALYHDFADSITTRDLMRQAEEAGKRFPIPKLKGGKPEIYVVERTPEQATYIDLLIERAENLPDDPSVDNLLKIMGENRLLSLDQRLMMPDAPDDPNSKVNQIVQNAHEIWKDTRKQKGTQLIFCDLSTPKSARGESTVRARAYARAEAEDPEGDAGWVAYLSKDNLKKYADGTATQKAIDTAKQKYEDGEDVPESAAGLTVDDLLADQADFSVYDDIKEKLVRLGVPAAEIAFIHDANTDVRKQALFDAVNAGTIRILLGSTSKMGAGMNVQRRLVALHHADAPWRPSDLEQREGRMLRQGNMFYEADPDGFEVRILRYVTRGSLDENFWGMIERKAKVVEQLRSGDTSLRRIADVGDASMNAAEMRAAASMNPLIAVQVELSRKLADLDMVVSAHRRATLRLRDSVRKGERAEAEYQASIKRIEARHKERMAALAKDLAYREEHDPKDDKGERVFRLTGPDGKEYEKRTDAAKALDPEIPKLLLKAHDQKAPLVLFQYRGLTLTVDFFKTWSGRPAVRVAVKGLSEDYTFELSGDDEVKSAGLIQRVDNFLARLDEGETIYEKSRADALKDAERTRDTHISDGKRAAKELEKPFPEAAELEETRKRYDDVMAQLQAQGAEQKDHAGERGYAIIPNVTLPITAVNAALRAALSVDVGGTIGNAALQMMLRSKTPWVHDWATRYVERTLNREIFDTEILDQRDLDLGRLRRAADARNDAYRKIANAAVRAMTGKPAFNRTKTTVGISNKALEALDLFDEHVTALFHEAWTAQEPVRQAFEEWAKERAKTATADAAETTDPAEKREIHKQKREEIAEAKDAALERAREAANDARDAVLARAVAKGIPETELRDAWRVIADGENENLRLGIEAGIFTEGLADWWEDVHIRRAYEAVEDKTQYAKDAILSGNPAAAQEALSGKPAVRGKGPAAVGRARKKRTSVSEERQSTLKVIHNVTWLHTEGSEIVANAITTKRALDATMRQWGVTKEEADEAAEAAGRPLYRQMTFGAERYGWQKYWLPFDVHDRLTWYFDRRNAGIAGAIATALQSRTRNRGGWLEKLDIPISARQKVLSLFKMAQVAANPAGWFTEILGNPLLIMLNAGYNPVQAFVEGLPFGLHQIATNGTWYRLALEHVSSMSHTFAVDEFGRGDPGKSQIHGKRPVQAFNRLLQATSNGYGNVERAYRVWLFRQEVKRGQSYAEAAKTVNRTLLDYSRAHPWVEAASRTNLVLFIKFASIALAEAVKEGVLKHPQRVAAMMGALVLVNNLSGIPKDERDAITRDMPVTQKISTIFVGRDEHGRPRTVNLMKYNPLSPNTPMGSLDPVKDVINAGVGFLTPEIKAPIEWVTGRDLYSGREISKSPDTRLTGERNRELASNTLRSVAPPWTPVGGRSARNVREARAGRTDYEDMAPNVGRTVFSEVTGVRPKSTSIEGAMESRNIRLRAYAKKHREQLVKLILEQAKYPEGSREWKDYDRRIAAEQQSWDQTATKYDTGRASDERAQRAFRARRPSTP